MVAVPSTMATLGTPAPDFDLPDTVSGRRISLKTYAGKRGLLVMFISRHCPYVQHVKHELARIGVDYTSKDIGIAAICSNDVTNYPDDSPAKLKEMAQEMNLTFPICYDESQKVALDFAASCTPDFFLFDEKRRLVYRGQLDDARPGNGKPVTGKDLRAAIDALLAGKPVSRNQKPSLGCNIKWKAGNEPSYFTQARKA